jgi:predicted RNA-binding Zn-ribbon protein involved in translation (DUF1610 family)
MANARQTAMNNYEPPKCSDCGALMAFVMQLGTILVWRCPGCGRQITESLWDYKQRVGAKW